MAVQVNTWILQRHFFLFGYEKNWPSTNCVCGPYNIVAEKFWPVAKAVVSIYGEKSFASHQYERGKRRLADKKLQTIDNWELALKSNTSP